MPAEPEQSAIRDWLAHVERAKPFLKWAGGKRPFLWSYANRIPNFPGDYIEPFLGSGAVFFHIMARRPSLKTAYLGDVNRHLVGCFLDVRDRPRKVYEELTGLQKAYEQYADPADFYYEQREIHNRLSPKSSAARFIFLNRTCWNGLYRINRDGQFNVPYGRPKAGSVIPTLDELLCAQAALANSSIRASKWQATLGNAKPGDFVFLDPPYFSDLTNRTSVKYQQSHFSLADHTELADTAAELARRGVLFILTNSAEDEMKWLYESVGLHAEEITVKRSISSKVASRGAAAELIVTPPGMVQAAEDADVVQLRFD